MKKFSSFFISCQLRLRLKTPYSQLLNSQLLRCHLPLSIPRFFVLLAFSKSKNELHKVAIFCQENDQQSCKMLSISIGGRLCAINVFHKNINQQLITDNRQQTTFNKSLTFYGTLIAILVIKFNSTIL